MIHFAAKSLVGESMLKPDIYFRNNVLGTMNLIHAMLQSDCRNLVFSSTAAIFGNPQSAKINEEHPKKPINPYGKSKLMVEQMLESICSAYDFNTCCLRYFNAAGADHSGGIGEAHDPETHLIPNVLRSLLGGDGVVKVFGDDYETYDGTCVRDYVHVNDLSQAHLLALEFLENEPGFHAFNLGNGSGYSVLDVIKVSSEVAKRSVKYEPAPRRAGDPPILVSDSRLAINKLGWEPEFGSLMDIISSAWLWHETENIL